MLVTMDAWKTWNSSLHIRLSVVISSPQVIVSSSCAELWLVPSSSNSSLATTASGCIVAAVEGFFGSSCPNLASKQQWRQYVHLPNHIE